MALWFKTVDELEALLKTYQQQNAQLARMILTIKKAHYSANQMNMAIADINAVLDTLFTAAKEQMNNTTDYVRGELLLYLTSGYGLDIKPGAPPHLTSFTFSNGSSNIVANSTLDVFNDLAVNDKIEIIGAGNSANDQVYDVTSKTDNKTLVISPAPVSDSNDTTARLIWRYDAV
jgi:hypothetical protein